MDQVQDASGVTHGFSGLWGSSCNTNFVIRYFEGSGTTWSVQATPYRGFVVAVAWDTTGTYLLYMDPALNLRITKRQVGGDQTVLAEWTSAYRDGGRRSVGVPGLSVVEVGRDGIVYHRDFG
ncbi:MAG TPA: hypothetical protein VJ849_09795 [Actinomycetes bacterium]|nr:hypothetical protein [Actinomycetes bacterium]